MAKKKQSPKKGKSAKPRRAAKARGFAPTASSAIEGLARKFAARRRKARLSPLAIAQEIADAAWEAARPKDQVALAEKALSVSADCADAYLILANQAPSRQMARQLLEEGVAAGARAIGNENFAAAAGHFWLDQRTRPYMRARLGLAQCLWESGQRSEAAAHYADMLKLNPSDNQGVRYLLLAALVDLDRDADAKRLLDRYLNDASAEWAYTTALLAFRREGDSPAARSLLKSAVDINRFAPEFLLGNKNLPPAPPMLISPGGEDEAVSYAAHFLRSWRGSPGAIPWMRRTLKVPLPQAPKSRKPVWSLFRHTFLRLPQVEKEAWQLDVCRLPLSTSAGSEPIAAADPRATRPAWTLVIWNRTQDAILVFEASEHQPSITEAWDALVEALLRPRPAGGYSAEPHRPAEIHLRRKTFFSAWRPKLRQIGIACRLMDSLDGLEEVLENVLPASARSRHILEGPETSDAIDLDDLAALPQSIGEAWQADIRRLPGWIEQEGELRRPWASLVTSRDEHAVLTQNLMVDPPHAEWIWNNVADAMLRPMTGEPHRPGVVEIAGEAHRAALQERLEAIGVRCVQADDLEQIDEIFRQLGRFLSGGKAARPLVEVPGVRLDDIRGFYAAAADFYRAAPWRLVPGDTILKIECPKFQANTWYAVVMGQSGLVLGLALYEDLQMLRRLFSARSDEQMSRQATGLSVMFGEAFEAPIADLDAAMRHGWAVAGDEAYPNPIYVNPGRSMRPPLAWELELLEGCLRAVPQFLQSGLASAEFDIACARGELPVRVSQMDAE